MRIAQAFGNRVAVAIELSERVGRKAVQSLLEGQELERKRLARELHDETGQALASILLGLKSLEQQVGPEPVARIRELVGGALDDVRRLTVELRPPALDDFGLEAALERLTSLVGERSGIDIQLSVRSPVALPADQETAIYRIVQEALTNIVKHAGASSVSIIVMATGGSVRLVIEDDGDGFDPANVREGALGLVGVRERVSILGGRFELEAAPGAGTTIVVELARPDSVKTRSGGVAIPGSRLGDRAETGCMSQLTVLICDDHALVRAGLRRLIELEQDISVVGEAADGEEAIVGTGHLRPDVLLLDVVLPGRSGIEILPELLLSSPETRILVLSMQDDPAYVRQAFASGASGYLLKEAADSELVQAIHDVAQGRRYVHPLLGARLAAAEAAAEQRTRADPLSEREHEVLRLLALGHTNQEIAKLLHISIRTAETHRARIMQKLGLKSRAEIVRYALESGALELDHPGQVA